MTEMQRQFEEWAIKEDFDTDYGSYIESEYNSIFTQIAWESWQASRAAIVVKLPEYEFGNAHMNILIDDFKVALDDLGVSYE